MARLPSLPVLERERAEKAKREAKEATREDAEKAKAAYIKDETKKLVFERGISQLDAERIVTQRVEGGSLDDGDVLTFTGTGPGESHTVGHVLDNIEHFFGQVVKSEEIMACWQPAAARLRAVT